MQKPNKKPLNLLVAGEDVERFREHAKREGVKSFRLFRDMLDAYEREKGSIAIPQESA